MALYESDSSDEDFTDYARTDVLLGYASRIPTEDTVSHLGGTPVSFPLRFSIHILTQLPDMAGHEEAPVGRSDSMRNLQGLDATTLAATR